MFSRKCFKNWMSIPLAATICTASAWAGVGSSGGGSVVYPTPGAPPVLLDLFLENPSFTDIASLPSDQIQVSLFASTLGYDRIDVRALPSYALAKQRLKAWKQNSPVVTRMIENALLGMEWAYTPFRQDLCSEAKAANESLHVADPLESAVVYRKDLGAMISAPVWNRIGEYSHSGLLLHEALRHVQFAVGENLDYSVLMTITAKILLEDPVQQPTDFTLDNPKWFSGAILGQIAQSETFKKEAEEICRAMESEIKELPILAGPLSQCYQQYCGEFRAQAPWIEIGERKNGEFPQIAQMTALDQRVHVACEPVTDAASKTYLANQIDERQLDSVSSTRISMYATMADQNARLLGELAHIATGSAAALGRVFTPEGITESMLPDYLNGNRRAYNSATRDKLDRAIQAARARLQKALLDHETLRCE